MEKFKLKKKNSVEKALNKRNKRGICNTEKKNDLSRVVLYSGDYAKPATLKNYFKTMCST